MGRLDSRTKLALGLMAIVAILIGSKPETLTVECIVLMASLPVLGMWRPWVHSLRLIGPMIGMVFIISLLSFDLSVALILSVRLLNLLTVSFIFFRSIAPEELGGALRKMGLPFSFAFILTTAMRYVPLMGQKIRHILDAQLSRGIDLRPRPRNVGNFMALFVPLLVQSFLLSEELAMAMESRGFGRAGRSSRREYRLALWEYGLMVVSLTCLVLFAIWEKG
ncbi:MAG: energy-coupling factor transporter transmembrane protein EcfT [Desulfobacteraceae bacterium]|nr:energy-coupling factor transporter transmembrane protein EcfT [Desulfobacteraceae bacterium]